MRSGTWCITSQPRSRSRVHISAAAARTVHIVVAEYADGFAMLHRERKSIGRDIHVHQHRRIGQQRAQRRIKEVARRIQIDTARGHQTTNNLRQTHALADAKPDAVLAGAPNPPPPRLRLRG